MKVLMLSKALVVGTYHKKIEELAKLGVEVHLIIPATWGNQLPEIVQGNGYSISVLPVYFSGKNHFHFYRGLSSIMETKRPDIFHIDEEPYSIVTYQAIRVGKKKGIPSFFFTWQNIYKRYPFPFSFIERYNYRKAGVAIAGNQEAKEVLEQKGFAKEIFVIPQFGVDPGLYSRHHNPIIKEKLFHSPQVQVIGYIGRLVEEKGLLMLLEAFSALPESACLLLVGSGPLKQEIIAKANQIGVGQRVAIVENVPSEKVPEYLSSLDCLVLPSLTRGNWKEQFGRVLIEAMACEVPVIGSDSGEIPRVIGDAGLVFKEGEVSDLQRKIELLIFDHYMKEEYSKRGLARVLGNFTQKHIAVQTLQVYQKLLNTFKHENRF